jgi:serine/threonine-protein kinase
MDTAISWRSALEKKLLSGHRPFEGEQFLHVIHQILTAEAPPLGTLRAGLPPSLVALVERAMAKDAAARLPTVTALADALMPFAGRASVRPDGEDLGHLATVLTPGTMGGAPLRNRLERRG